MAEFYKNGMTIPDKLRANSGFPEFMDIAGYEKALKRKGSIRP